VKGPKRPKKTWAELSHQFAEWEKQQHSDAQSAG
jgi:hypothetical protein